ncbi:MAG: UDP-N-acetylmuramoyl-tripeptide--D-alanyl-D-alanine ligase [Lachnospiraceae bacterium]|jgi:UDP-N-acetylmuramoyl-tripeptide--D-alanyl-D-alanine ligase|nr:UDP-N-acetylmuramoyl-tripeptide--D-alanyl-D-alanine ligase [Lachnospiraceae bacterium]
MKNLSFRNITKVCDGEYRGDEKLLDVEVSAVVIDNREVTEGSLFVAIDGRNVNAHKFIPDAVKRGASLIVSQEDLGEPDFPYILVKDSGQGLLDIAKLYRDSLDIKVVGITGSVGKTSTKEAIATVLSEQFKVHKTIGNFNNEWGLPLTIFAMPEDTEIAILEMGVNHFGEMRRLSQVASPDICVITNIGTSHLEFFKTREGILKEKSQMIEDMKDGGHILLNGDDDLLRTIPPHNGICPLYFGTNKEDHFYVDEIKSLGLNGTHCHIHMPNFKDFEVTVPIPGEHFVMNALCASACGCIFWMRREKIKAGIEKLKGVTGRNNIIKTERYTVLDDCYNASPTSMMASLDVMKETSGRKVAILGDMGELGENSVVFTKEVGEYARDNGIDVIIAIGNLAKNYIDTSSDVEQYLFDDKESFYLKAGDILQNKDNIMIKASHGAHFEEIVDYLVKL